MKPRLIQTLMLPMLLMLAGRTPSVAAAEKVMSIEGLVAIKSDWNDSVGAEFRLDGRYSSLTGRHALRFEKCDLQFRSVNELPRLTGDNRNVEVVGKIAKDKDQLYFAISRLKKLPTELESFRRRRSKISGTKPEPWYALGQWARERSLFYGDKELAAIADTAFLDGINVERKNITTWNSATLKSLVTKAASLQLPESMRQVFTHEAYQQAARAIRKRDDGEELEKFVEQMATDLPGSADVSKAAVTKLRDKYLAEPLAVYTAANSEQRRALHRIFRNDIVLATVVSQVKSDGSNGFDIADSIEKQVPERTDLTAAYRDRAIKFRTDNLAASTRQDILELRAILQQRKQTQQATDVVRRWLALRDESLQRDDRDVPGELIRLSEEYITLLRDQPAAAALLMRAYKQSPQPQIAAKLKGLGYKQQSDRWLNNAEIKSAPESDIERAMRQGRVTLGMTAKQVRGSQGFPNRVVRIATNGKINTIWIYEQGTGSRMVIHFIRAIQRDDPKVVAISR